MAGAVLYRKWRPRRFGDIVGQDAIVRTLRNAVSQDKIAHAYLFAGPRGTGKTSTGRILAKAVNAGRMQDGEPVLDDATARDFDEGRALDLVEIDAASNRGIDNIRDLRERANYVPSSSTYKVYLIDEVHQLTDAAADALLKTLEEPPPHVIFILATTEPEALKATVLSRCQRFDFRRVSVEAMLARLRTIAEAEGIAIPDDALTLIAREATGSVRDAINLLDQVWATYGDTVTLEQTAAALGLSADHRAMELAGAAVRKDLAAGLALLAAVQDDAVDLGRFNRQVITHLRAAMLLQAGASERLALSEPEHEALSHLVKDVDAGVTFSALKAFSAADVRTDPYSSLPLELALAQIVLEPELPAEPPAAPAARPAQALAGAAGGRKSRDGGRRERQSGPARSQAGAQPRSQQPRPRSTPQPSRQPDQRPDTAAPAASTPPAPARLSPERKTPQRRELTPEEQTLLAIRQGLKSRGDLHLSAYLNGSCKIVALDQDRLMLGFFPTYQSMHQGKVNEQREAVAAVASEVLGRTVTVDVTAVEDEVKSASPLVAEAERLGARRLDP